MFEGLFQPIHVLAIFGLALLVFGPNKLPELSKGIGEGDPWLQVSHEKRREAGQRQTHHRGDQR
jgi:Sec-independent protein translocase protein TatA